jgi:hypothetical protein
VLLLVLVCVLFEHEIVEGHEVEHALLEVYRKQVEVIWLGLAIRLILVQTNENVINGARHHYYKHQEKEEIHLKNDYYKLLLLLKLYFVSLMGAC